MRWGFAVFKPDASVDRKAVASHLFGPGDAAENDREFLESLTHPRIGERLEVDVSRFMAEGRKVVVLDAALLFEAGWNKLCDLVVFVDSSRENRLRRARTRGWSDAEFGRREAAQWPVEDKRRAADFVLKNDGSEADLRQAVANFWGRHSLGS
jgi:dephospho-CoA kinase